MNLFNKEKRFCAKTGKELEAKLVHSGKLVCDFCGDIIEEEYGDDYYGHSYTVNEYDGMEHSYHEEDRWKDVDNYKLMEEHPVYVFHTYCEGDFMAHASQYSFLFDALFSTRMKMLNATNYTLEDFNLERDNW